MTSPAAPIRGAVGDMLARHGSPKRFQLACRSSRLTGAARRLRVERIDKIPAYATVDHKDVSSPM